MKIFFYLIFLIFTINSFSQVAPSRISVIPSSDKLKIATCKDSIIHNINIILDSYTSYPDNPVTWAAAKEKITQFLIKKWRAGILQGTKANQAFFVKADQTTMTQSDINMKKLVVMVGFAMVKPSEFDVTRFEKQL